MYFTLLFFAAGDVFYPRAFFVGLFAARLVDHSYCPFATVWVMPRFLAPFPGLKMYRLGLGRKHTTDPKRLLQAAQRAPRILRLYGPYAPPCAPNCANLAFCGAHGELRG